MSSINSLNRNLRRGTIGAVLALATALGGTAAMAQQHQPPANCSAGQGGKNCQQQGGKGGPQGGQQGGHAQNGGHQGGPGKAPAQRPDDHASNGHGNGHNPPHVGDPGRQGQRVPHNEQAKLPPPPSHQHYRVVDDRVVRVDDDTLKIVAVLGLASVLLNN